MHFFCGKQKTYCLYTLVVFFAAFLPTIPSIAQISEPIVLSGTEAPGTGLTYESFISPFEDEDGLVIFQGILSDDSRGIWLYENGELTEVLRQGQPLPGGSGENIAMGFAPVIIGIEEGTFAIWVGIESGGGAILMGDRTSLNTIAYDGMAAPGTDLLFRNINNTLFPDIISYGFNNGQVVFTALATDSLQSEAANGAWVSSGGAPTLVALGDRDQFDEVDEWPEVPGHVFDIRAVRISESGTVYYKAEAVDPVATYLIKGIGSGRSVVNLGAGISPGVIAISEDERLGLMAKTDTGQLVLLETAPGSGSFETVASTGDTITDRSGNPIAGITWENFAQSGIGFDGQGRLYLDGGTSANLTTHGFWRRNLDGTLQLHVEGEFIEGSVLKSPNGLALNEVGDMLLGGENGRLYYQATDSDAPNLIFARNDELTIGPGDVRQIDFGALAATRFNSPSYEGRPSALTNGASTLAVLRFEDDSFGIIRFSSLAGGLAVNSTGDDSDTNPGDGECSTGGNVGGVPECTLRAAIEESNASTERGNILFDIPGDAPHAITVDSPLPALTNSASITGPSYSDLPGILLDGISAGQDASGLIVSASAAGSTIRNLWVLTFDGPGISINANDVRIESNVLGLDGSQLTGNDVGLQINGNNNTIENNLISGNGAEGINLSGNDNKVTNNIIGLDKTGSEDLGNGSDGVVIAGDSNVLESNKISRNSKSGVRVTAGNGNQFFKNYIGTDINGTERIGNVDHGILLEGGSNTLVGAENEGNVLSGNLGNGLMITGQATTTVVLGNFIGTDPQGNEGPFNVNAGVFILSSSGHSIGGIDYASRNIIRDNEFGVIVEGDAQNNTIRHNAIYGNRVLDIDLGDDRAITPNDLGNGQDMPDQDSGPNGLMNFPVAVTLGTAENGQRVLSGIIDTIDPASVTIDIYGVETPNELGVGGGLEWIGSGNPDSTGIFQFVIPNVSYQLFSATATDANGATSEFSPVCSDPDGDGKPDSDGDGLCDIWEQNGIDYDMDGQVDLEFKDNLAADPMKKDIFIEVDWMAVPGNGAHNHEPLQGSLDAVVAAFASAPVTNPNGQTGIKMHFVKDEQVPEITPIRMHSGSVKVDPAGTFNDIKLGKPVNPCGTGDNDGHFGKKADRMSDRCPAILGARRLAYRYLLFGHDHAHNPGSSGVAELPGNDFMVTLGSWSNNALLVTASFQSGATAQLSQARTVIESSTIMHEFGHTLNLRHGGADNFNCKPNYISVMNYALQFPYMIPNRPLNYSSKALPDLDESKLNETAGLGGKAGEFFLYNTSAVVGMKGTQLFYGAANDSTIDWSGNGTLANEVSIDIDYIPASGCEWSPQLRTLTSQDDWSNIVYDFRTTLDFDDGGQRTAPSSFEPENDPETASEAAMNFDFDGDGFVNALDNCAAISNPGQEDIDFDGVGDVCEMGQADLSLTADVRNFTTDQNAAEQREHFRLVISNAGPDSVAAIALSDTLFAEGEIQYLAATKGGCTASGTIINCAATDLAPQDSMVVTFDVLLPNLTEASFSAAVSGDALDANPDNNAVARAFTVNTDDPHLPLETRLYQNFPNPFLTSTRVAFDVASTAHVKLTVYDLLGRRVIRAVDEQRSAGHHEVAIDGAGLASGVYVYRLEVAGEVFTRRMVRLR